jgi:hypothetical protein
LLTPAQSSLKHIKPGMSWKSWREPKHAVGCKIAVGGKVLWFYEKFHIRALFIFIENRRYIKTRIN